ncbi:MAG: FHA domain-containing protein [Chloroflexi bacterium]|nr:FHA domain-containing protein [Chloroflexota bacterium]
MDITSIIAGGIVSIIVSLITAYITTQINLRQEKVKWQRELSQRIVTLRSADNEIPQIELLAQQFAIGYFILEELGKPEKRKIFMTPGRLTVGRMNCDVNLPEKSISRTHAIFESDEIGEVYVQDLETKFGVFVNGIHVGVGGRFKLTDGDTIRLGKRIHLVFHYLKR